MAKENVRFILSDGANFLYLRGDEDEDIFPVWDWARVPGITEAATDSEGATCRTVNRSGNSPFVGGVSNGVVGLSAMDLECGTLRGKRHGSFLQVLRRSRRVDYSKRECRGHYGCQPDLAAFACVHQQEQKGGPRRDMALR